MSNFNPTFLLAYLVLLFLHKFGLYKPRNPAFGGDTFNYQWLMSSAENQNKFKINLKKS
jgi:curli production assembly/transport component CsgF